MGTNCARLLADHSLHPYDIDVIQNVFRLDIIEMESISVALLS